MTSIAGGIFIGASFMLGTHCGVLAPPVLGLLLLYSAMKRFSSSAHLVLGVCLACAPGGAWYALMGTFSWIPAPLMAGVAFWVCGFDILYSCQDEVFDRESGLKSIPSTLGIAAALPVARLCHLLSFALLLLFGVVAQLGLFYYAGLVIFAVVVMSQHLAISVSNVDKIGRAFFTRNGFASLLFLLAVISDVWSSRV